MAEDFGAAVKSAQRRASTAGKRAKAKRGKSSKRNRAYVKAKSALDTARKRQSQAQDIANIDPNSKSVADRVQKQMGPTAGTQFEGLTEGVQFGSAILGEEGLGRVGDDPTIQAMEAQAAELAKGFSSEEMQARKEKGIQDIQGTTEAQARAAQAQMARSGVKGMQAGSQIAGIRQQGIEARGNLERDLMIQNREAQMRGLEMQSGMVTGNRQFDLGQAAKEKDIVLQSGLGFSQMSSADRGAEAARDAQIRAARASKQSTCFLQGTDVLMHDGTTKKIENIKLGDTVKFGGIVYALQQGITSEIYKYKNVYVTGGHAVLEEDKWIRVKDSAYAEKEEGVFVVYNMSNSMHRIATDLGFVFADFDETDFASKINDDHSLEVLNGKRTRILENGGRS